MATAASGRRVVDALDRLGGGGGGGLLGSVCGANLKQWKLVRYAPLTIASILIIVAVSEQELPWTLFTPHPIFMSAAIGFAGAGILAYSLVEPGPVGRLQARQVHAMVGLFAALATSVGLIFIVARKVSTGKTVIPVTLHGIVGAIVLVALVGQFSIGYIKYRRATANPGAPGVFKAHGKVGPFIFLGYLLVAILGAAEHYTTPRAVVAIILLVALGVVIMWVRLRPHPPVSTSYQMLSRQADGVELA